MSIIGQMDSHGFVWTRERLTFARLIVAGVDANSAARDAKLSDDENVDALLKHDGFVARCADIRDYVLRKAAENEDSIIARYANWAEGNIFDYVTAREGMEEGTISAASLSLRDITQMPKHMQQRVKKLTKKTTVTAAGEHVTNWELELHDSMRANAELAKLLGIGGVSAEDAEDVANAIYEFLQEAESVRSVEGGEFPPQEQVDV